VLVWPGLWGAALLGACALDAAQALRPCAAEAQPAGAASGAGGTSELQEGMHARESLAHAFLPGVSCLPLYLITGLSLGRRPDPGKTGHGAAGVAIVRTGNP